MKILHTSDWHVGKKLGRFDRSEEHRLVIEEVSEIADREQVDLVVNSGDLFDRPIPAAVSLDLGLGGLVRLTDNGNRPVVAIAGNHDSPQLFDTLGKFLPAQNVWMVGTIKPPDEGGILDLPTSAGRVVVSCFPFLREGRDYRNVWQPPGEQYSLYADRIRRISECYAQAAAQKAGTDAVTVLTAHFLVGGAKVHGHGYPRGERVLHMGEAYAADGSAIPPGPQYVALGHIHAPQTVPGSPAPAEYAGSLLQSDFGEAGETKRVVIVDVEPGLPAKIKYVNLTQGRPLVRLEGTWNEIEKTELDDNCWLSLTVKTEGPEPGLLDLARSKFPDNLVHVKADWPRTHSQHKTVREGRNIVELYEGYYQQTEGVAPPDDLTDTLKRLREQIGEASDASP